MVRTKKFRMSQMLNLRLRERYILSERLIQIATPSVVTSG